MTNVAFDGKGGWSFGNDTPRKFELFRADNSSSFHTDNLKIDFLIFGEALTFGINKALVHQKKHLVLILVKQRQTFAWVSIIILIIVNYL